MDGVKIDYKKILEIVLIGIGCYWALNNFQIILDIFNSILAVIMPFLLGIMIAFILNVLMIRIEKILSRFILDKKYTSFKRVISIIVSLLIVIGVIGIIITLIIPELTNAIKVIVKSFPETFEQLQVWINQNGNSFPQLETWINSVDLNSIASELSGLFKIGLTGMLGSTVDVISMFFTSILNLVVGIVFALYILMSKETLKRQIDRCLYSKTYFSKIVRGGDTRSNNFFKFCDWSNS